MESGSAVVQKEERIKKYQIYVEEYVLSYLRREADSLELSEIYFYGLRQEDGRKIFVYGAGRDKGIEAFSQYEPLSELVCRLTQAGPVFMVRESNGECKVNGFQIFYENNEAMQSYLLEWTGSAQKDRKEEKSDRQDVKLPVLISAEEKPKKEVHGAISVQLCLILMLLTAIVITSTDSYDKMRQMGQSAKEVFFAIENQEAEDSAEDFDKAEGQDEIVVERNGKEEAGLSEENLDDESELSQKELEQDQEPAKENAGNAGNIESAGNAENFEDKPEEGQLKPVEDEPSEESAKHEQDQAEEEKSSEQEDEPEEGEEALSRSVTRYYEVEQGDTLYTISQKIYGDFSRVEKICEVNQITDPDKIRSGQRIILP